MLLNTPIYHRICLCGIRAACKQTASCEKINNHFLFLKRKKKKKHKKIREVQSHTTNKIRNLRQIFIFISVLHFSGIKNL